MVHIFIINPFAGQQTFADNLRARLGSYENLDYFVFNTRHAGYETELVKKIQNIFEGEKLRFYCCGGSGTMRHMLNGFDDLSDVEVAFYPCGLTNDFLKVFGENEEKFHSIDELIDGNVIDIDYIRTEHGVALNTLSTGLDSNCQTKMNELRSLRFISDKVPYMLAVIYSLFVSKTREYEIKLDNDTYSGYFSEIYFGNGHVLGGNIFFADNACATDGLGITRLATVRKRGFPLAMVLLDLMKKNFARVSKKMKFGLSKTIEIKRADGKPFTINQDGELIHGVTSCKGEIVKKGLHFVVPKGVRL